MLTNKRKAGKYRRNQKVKVFQERELIFKEDREEYAQVIQMLGCCRLQAMCLDDVKRCCHIRGILRKRVSECHTNDVMLS